jgi:hypothetical protein
MIQMMLSYVLQRQFPNAPPPKGYKPPRTFHSRFISQFLIRIHYSYRKSFDFPIFFSIGLIKCLDPQQEEEQSPTLEEYTVSLLDQLSKQQEEWKRLRELLEQQQRIQFNQHYLISQFQYNNHQIDILNEKRTKLFQRIQLQKLKQLNGEFGNLFTLLSSFNGIILYSFFFTFSLLLFYFRFDAEWKSNYSLIHFLVEDSAPAQLIPLQLELAEVTEQLQNLNKTQREIQNEINKISDQQFRLHSELKRVYAILYPKAVFRENTIFINLSSYAHGTIEKQPQNPPFSSQSSSSSSTTKPMTPSPTSKTSFSSQLSMYAIMIDSKNNR